MIPLGYGKFARADRIFAVVPIPESEERGDGRRTYVHVEGIAEPLIASRSERAILADLEDASPEPRRRRRRQPAGQGELPV
jgi:predicted amidophosphoribosyltransferase